MFVSGNRLSSQQVRPRNRPMIRPMLLAAALFTATLFTATLFTALIAAQVQADDQMRTERVHFAPGATSAVIAGSIEGRESLDFLLSARAGQTLKVTMETDNSANYFNLIPPDAEDVAVYTGSNGPEFNQYEGELDLDGDWKIRVYLYRAAARRGERADYRLDISITGAPDPSAARAANDFGPRQWDARGHLGCARGGQPMQTGGCPFKVIRYRTEAGATVFVQGAERRGEPRSERTLYFQQGDWSTPTSDPVSATKRADLWILSVGDEVYEIPEAILGGG